MKIGAIRLKEVGRFREAVALEGLTGGLNVLAGPNELGKSTILKALKLALFSKHTSKAGEVEACRPYAGGAPLIEVDFEIDGATWRIRKQFLSARAAELKELRSGFIARGGDAETKLEALLNGKDGAGRFALLWVDQGTPLAPVEPARSGGSAFMVAVEDEAESVADGGAAREVLALLKAELGELITGHTPPRPTGRYKAALEERDSLRRQREEARARLTGAEARLDKLAVLRQQVACLADPAAAAARAGDAAAAARAFEEASAARERCRQAEEAAQAQEERLSALKGALAGIDGQMTDLAKLEEAEARERPALEETARRAHDAEAKESQCRRRRDDTKSALAAAEAERKAIELALRLKEAAERLKSARTAAADIKSLAAALDGNGADEGVMAAVRREAQAIATLEARLSAAAPTVSVAYARGGQGKIKIGGRPLEDGETLSPARPMALEIEGVGVLTIAPGRSEGVAEDEADLAAHAAELAALLQRIGASSVETAEARAAERRALQGKLAEAQAHLKAQAPDGAPALERHYAELSAKVPAPATRMRSASEVDAQVLELADALAAAETDLAQAQAAHAEAREAAVKTRTRGEERRARIDMLATSLGDPSQCAARRTKAAAAVSEAEGALNRAVRDSAAWREKAPDDQRLAAFDGAAQAAKAAAVRAERELNELRRAEAGIEGELKADRADDVEARVAEIEETGAAAEARVAALEQEIGASFLLARELEAAESEMRESFAKPVIDRLLPYLDLVFPSARARFGEGLALDALERDGGIEELARLSEGTREQLAVLVRMGLGRLLAETGAPAPLVLDDALVYSDDARIERMFAALNLAAQSHQVLVLTCRERTFERLGGHRVAIEPWRSG